MKKILMIICVSALLLSLLLPNARSQVWGFGMATGDMNIKKIGSSARRVLGNYLAVEYQQRCPVRAKNLPAECHQTKAFYEGSHLSRKAAHALPPAVIKDIGFIEPGTDYAQAGFAVYLISIPRRIILDVVTLEETE